MNIFSLFGGFFYSLEREKFRFTPKNPVTSAERCVRVHGLYYFAGSLRSQFARGGEGGSKKLIQRINYQTATCHRFTT